MYRLVVIKDLTSRKRSCTTLQKKRRMRSFTVSHTQTVWRVRTSRRWSIANPPYAPLSATANFTAYHTNSFSLTQQAHLAEIAENLVSNRIPVLISNHDTALTREWYQLAKLHVVKVRRSISSNGGTRKKVDELLALYQPESQRLQENNSQGEADETVFDCPLNSVG